MFSKASNYLRPIWDLTLGAAVGIVAIAILVWQHHPTAAAIVFAGLAIYPLACLAVVEYKTHRRWARSQRRSAGSRP